MGLSWTETFLGPSKTTAFIVFFTSVDILDVGFGMEMLSWVITPRIGLLL